MSRLAPVAFDPDPAAAAVGPVAFDPAGAGVGRFHVGSGNPDVGVAVPAVVAGMPGPVAMLGRRRRNDFVGACRRPYTDDDLGLGNASSEEKDAGNSREEFLHRAISLIFFMTLAG
jgi:hypothetical protein